MFHTKQTKTPPTQLPFRFPLNGVTLKGSKSNNILPKNQKPKTKNYFAFTLVELIVVIVILAILATIAFLSFSSYSSSSRDSVRLSDVTNVKKSLELYFVNTGKYPVPSSPTHTVTYSGGLLFTEGTLGDSVFKILSNMSKKTIDPKVGVEYTYSVSNSNREYSIGTMSEGNSSSYIPTNNIGDLFTNKSFAANTTNTAIVSGNYNGVLSPLVNTGSMYYYMALPTIITSDTRTGNLEITAISTGAFVYDDRGNLPFTYQGGTTASTGVITFNPPVVYSGTTAPKTSTDVSTLVNGLKAAYSGSAIQNQPTIAKIVTATPQEVVNKTVPLINANGGTTINVAYIDPYAAYNTVLLHFDGVLGNSGSNAGVISNIGGVSFTGVGMAGNSAYFNGSNYLTIPDSNDWYFGTNNFTIDFWYKPMTATGLAMFWAQDGSSNNDGFGFSNVGTPGINILNYAAGAYTMNYTESPSYTRSVGQWYHIALVRNGTNISVYRNGARIMNQTDADPIINTVSSVYIGASASNPAFYRMNGYLDEFRVTKGIARRTGDFTPPSNY